MKELLTGQNAPPVSVIIPVYNGRSTLPDCLDALEKQDYPGFYEIIVVDDGSTDGSGDYAASKGCQVYRQRNQGPGVARNTGVNYAKGEFLVFTDDDCIPDANFIMELVKPLLGGDIIGSLGQIYSRQKSLVARFIHYEFFERYKLLNKVQYIDWVATYAACYRKEVFQSAGGFNDTYSSEDCELSFRLAQQGYKMVFAPQARCQHKHFENYFKFIKYKYKRAYWSIWLYKSFPSRIVKDRLTPFTRKLSMMFLCLFFLGLISTIWWYEGIWLALIGVLLWLIMILPLAWKILRADFFLGLLSPVFYLTRTLAYVLGVTHGIIDYCRGVRSVKKSAAK